MMPRNAGDYVKSWGAALIRGAASNPEFTGKCQIEQYCQNEKIYDGKTERLVTCRSSKVGVSIQDTVDVSSNERWKVNLAHIITDADFLSRDITYNKRFHIGNCFTAPELARLVGESERFV